MPVETPGVAPLPFQDVLSATRSASDQNALLESDQAMAQINQANAQKAQMMMSLMQSRMADRSAQQTGAPAVGTAPDVTGAAASPSLTASASAVQPYINMTLQRINQLESDARDYQFLDPAIAKQSMADADRLRQNLFKTDREQQEERRKGVDWVLSKIGGAGENADALAAVMPTVKQLYGGDPSVAPIISAIESQRGLDGRYVMDGRMKATIDALAQASMDEKSRGTIDVRNQAIAERRDRDQDRANVQQQMTDIKAAEVQAKKDRDTWEQGYRQDVLDLKRDQNRPQVPQFSIADKQAISKTYKEQFPGLPSSQADTAAADYANLVRENVKTGKMSLEDAESDAQAKVTAQISKVPGQAGGFLNFGGTPDAHKYAGLGAAKQASANNPAPAPMPTVKTDLKAGTTYQTPRGPAKWDGAQFVQ